MPSALRSTHNRSSSEYEATHDAFSDYTESPYLCQSHNSAYKHCPVIVCSGFSNGKEITPEIYRQEYLASTPALHNIQQAVFAHNVQFRYQNSIYYKH